MQNYETILKHDLVNNSDGIFQYVIKQINENCYAGHKDQSGQVLKQGNCRHCSPWGPSKCVNCSKTIEKVETIHLGKNGETFCSRECVNIYYNKDIPKTTKICSFCGKTISNLQITHDGKDYCSSECLAKGITPENNPQQNPPKSPNNNSNEKGMSTGLKIFFWIGGTALIMGSIGIMFYKISQKKRNHKS